MGPKVRAGATPARQPLSAAMAASNALLIFAKAPQPGSVKTRLLPAVSPRTAAEIHGACIADTLLLARSVKGADIFLFAAGGRAFFSALRRDGALPPAPAGAPRVFAQKGNDLGERLADGFRKIFQRRYAGIVVIGTDTPWMGAARVRRAFRSLARADVVLGPSADGGYYLLGARRYLPGLFQGISWGSGRVWRETLRALSQSRATWRVLPLDFDLDRPADLRRAARLLSAHPERAPHLAQLLGSLGLPQRIQPPPATTSPQ